MRMGMLMSLLAATAFGQISPDRVAMLRSMDGQSEHFGVISKQIWEFAETAYKETRSAALLKGELREAGFRIEENIADIPTAFVATWGSGGPVIGILGEYDALPGLSQQDKPEKEVITAGAPGHGCGHNLFGTASAMAAISVREYLLAHHLPGTIVFFGTPAEESGSGKVYMARTGVFNRCDAILAWHPGDQNRAILGTSLANISAKFTFSGIASHAALDPDRGRSALDGLMLMNMCVEMLREHVPQETRMHYIVTNGGQAVNIVPALAEGSFLVRYPDIQVLEGIWDRVLACGDAGALGSGTTVKHSAEGGVYNYLPNRAITSVIEKNLKLVGGETYTPSEQAFAQELYKSYQTSVPLDSHAEVMSPLTETQMASTDVSDVSWIVPVGQFGTATYVPGTPAHSWQATACAGSAIGRKGMIVAAKTLALTAVDLLQDPATLASAKAEFAASRSGREYKSKIPAGAKPPVRR